MEEEKEKEEEEKGRLSRVNHQTEEDPVGNKTAGLVDLDILKQKNKHQKKGQLVLSDKKLSGMPSYLDKTQ